MTSSAESEEQGSIKKKKLTRLGSFSSKEVFRAWAHDSLLKPSTIETLMDVHQVDSLPAVLALRGKDLANLGLPIGQARLFQEAVIKLHAEYSYQEPFSPAIKVDVEFPSYKSMLDDSSPVNGKEDYFRFNSFGKTVPQEMGVEVGESFCDGESEAGKTLLQDKGVDDDDDEDDETQSGCACQRWLFISIFMPPILVVSVLGSIAWLTLWPINRFCPVGKRFFKIFQATENLVKLPVISLYWAIGKRRKCEEGSDQLQESDMKRNYGGTDDVSMNELEKTDR